MDFIEQAKRLYPWMPDELVRVFADSWADTGEPELAMAEMRRSPQYERHFPGNRRDDGTLRYSEQDYTSTIDGYRIAMSRRGVDPRVLEQRGWWERLIEGDVSVREFDERMQSHWELNQEMADQAADWYRTNYGIDASRESMLLSMVDPDIGQAVVQRRLTSAQIGGAASAFGFDRSKGRVDQLAREGLDPARARELYGTAAQEQRGMDARARRFFDPQGGVGVGDIEDALVSGDVGQQRRMERGVRAEQAQFGQGGLAERDRETGGVRGLAQR